MRKYSVVDEEGVVQEFVQSVGEQDHAALNDAIELAGRAGEDVVEHFADAFSYEVRNNNTHKAEAYTSEIFCLNSARALRTLTLASGCAAMLRFGLRSRLMKSFASRVTIFLTIRL